MVWQLWQVWRDDRDIWRHLELSTSVASSITHVAAGAWKGTKMLVPGLVALALTKANCLDGTGYECDEEVCESGPSV